jgi:hypothetical protein
MAASSVDRFASASSISRGLGWFSLALGASEVLITRRLSRAAGIDPRHKTLLRAFGFREITSGAGLLGGRDRRAWLWSRVVGDVLDTAFLGWSFATAPDRDRKKRIALAAAAVAPVVALDVYASLRKTGASATGEARVAA